MTAPARFTQADLRRAAAGVAAAGAYEGFVTNDLVWLAVPKLTTGKRQSATDLASGPMERWRAHTGPHRNAIGARHG